MCGIVAFFGKNSASKTKNGLERLAHRGRDSSKIIEVSDRTAIGFNRLAINDLTISGEQPFEYKDWIGVFNAEIYNHLELRQQFDLSIHSSIYPSIHSSIPLFIYINKDTD